MVKEYQIRGGQDSVFFIEQHLNHFSIMKLEFHEKSHMKIVKTEVYQLKCRLVAFESDHDLSNEKQSFFVLDKDQNVY